MRDIVVDFESYFDQQYSLRAMTTQEYIEDSRFQIMGMSVVDDDKAVWLEAEEVPDWVASIDWSEVNMIGHNLIFDGGVMAHHFGVVPRLYSDTISYARAVFSGMLKGFDLASVIGVLNGYKNTPALMRYKGIRQEEVDRSSPEWGAYKAYGISDSVASHGLYKRMLPHMPGAERVVVDILIRMFTQGKLILEPSLLDDAIMEAKIEAAEKLAAAGMSDKTQLRSRDQFAELLRGVGVEPPLKTSTSTGKLTYAFSKKDLAFMELLEHPDQRVRVLVDAKLNAASTINETRAARLKSISLLSDKRILRVPLAFSGAHTHRFSGLDKLNLQNLPSRGASKHLRMSIRAPKGHKLVVRDASQIEARMLAYVAGQDDLTTQFANDEDVYAIFASKIYNKLVEDKKSKERFIGKTGILGLGYGSGYITFLHMVLTSGTGNTIDEDFAREVVATYRSAYPQITKLWKRGDTALRAMADDSRFLLGPFETGFNRLESPCGLFINYPQLSLVPNDLKYTSNWQYFKPRYNGFTNIFGAKVIENIIQHLARNQIADTMVKMRATSRDWHCALQVHDELVYVAPDSEAEECDAHLSRFMNEQPLWTLQYNERLPLANEGGIGEVYGDVH